MHTLSRTAAAMVFVLGAILNPVHAGTPQQAIDEMRALVADAYVAGGWSDRDADAIAEVKVQRMADGKFDGDIPGFEPLDARGHLCEGSNGIAAVVDHFVQVLSWDEGEASNAVLSILGEFRDWSTPVGEQPGLQSVPPPVRETCSAYSVTYQFCRNGLVTTRTVYWDSECYYNNFEENPCVAVPWGCECAHNEYCAIEFVPTGNCGGATAGKCIRIIRRRFVEETDCVNIVRVGGCADCSPPQSLDPNCPTPIVASCVPKPIGPCGGCTPSGN